MPCRRHRPVRNCSRYHPEDHKHARNLTMSRYTHLLNGQEKEAVKRLPSLSDTSMGIQRATGTDGRQESTPESTPQSTPTAFSACSRLSPDCTTGVPGSRKAKNHKATGEGRLDARCGRMAPAVTDERAKPTVGFEPTTPGLQNQSSTVELRWRRISAVAARPKAPLYREPGLLSSSNRIRAS